MLDADWLTPHRPVNNENAPGCRVELVEGMENLCIMDAVDGLQKVTEIDGLQGMSSALMVSSGGLNKRGRGCPPLLVGTTRMEVYLRCDVRPDRALTRLPAPCQRGVAWV